MRHRAPAVAERRDVTGSLLVRPDADETGVAKSRGVDIAWRRYGDGDQTILFVPTWNFVDSRVLRHQVDGLRGQFRVITYDARGSGQSGRPRTGFRFEDHAADAKAVLDATDSARAAVVAASVGTHAAVLLASTHAARVETLVLVAPPIDVPSGDVAAAPDDEDPPVDWKTDWHGYVPWFISSVFPESGSQTTIDEIVAIALEADHSMLLQQRTEFDWDQAPALFSNVVCPTLVIDGDQDFLLSRGYLEAVAKALPDGHLMMLDGLGHRPDISRPEVVNPIIAEWVRTAVKKR